MKQRATKKKQTKKVKVAKAKAKEARRAAAAGDDVAMDAVANADEDVKLAQKAEESETKPVGRAVHALKVQARRALKVKIDTLKGKRSRIAKRDIGNKTTRKALSSSIKGLLHTKKAKGDDARALFDAAANGSDDDEWEEDVEMA